MSGGRYRLAPLARRDLAAQIDRLLVAAGAEVAGRFVEQARTSLAAIAEAPALGSPVPTRNHQLAGLRKRKITGFANVLVFYVAAPFVSYDQQFKILNSAAPAITMTLMCAVPAVLLYAALLRYSANPARLYTSISAVVFVVTRLAHIVRVGRVGVRQFEHPRVEPLAALDRIVELGVAAQCQRVQARGVETRRQRGAIHIGDVRQPASGGHAARLYQNATQEAVEHADIERVERRGHLIEQRLQLVELALAQGLDHAGTRHGRRWRCGVRGSARGR